MTVDALKALVMRQLGEDVDDVADYTELLDAYLEQGYVRMIDKYKSGDRTDVVPLATENILPTWTHPALADYATYKIMQNGNAQKQQRGQTYYVAFLDILSRMRSLKDEAELTANETIYGTKDYRITNLYSN